MNFGKTVGTACGAFAVTNIDDVFVLVTFFAQSATNSSVTPLRITIGQYVGFTVIMMVSMIGFGASLVLPTEPIGFLGLLPILLGVWWLFALLFPTQEEEEEEEEEETAATSGLLAAGLWKTVFTVASVTVMNGADNIGTYIPLFSQAKGAEIAVYAVVFYILLGLWCLVAFLVMKQRHLLRLAEKYAAKVVPFLYIGLGIFIVVNSECYPWSIEHIDEGFFGNPGTLIMALVTTFVLLLCIGAMLWINIRKRSASRRAEDSNREMADSQLPESRDQDVAQSDRVQEAKPVEREGQGASLPDSNATKELSQR
ncbi:cadmium resistance transporter [Colletotrichum musicola]|uniref:Cadmium resistance transporter n=1 Tax=Colletotrichum musicola TaxID=2175873 RepID=A0A8H6KC46_9PEZI|nr:cadmium resistance transporter [Colletotrichum musicola]